MSNGAEDVGAAYDATPYPGLSYWFTHPDQQAVMATLFGLSPAPVEGARVLEIGCATGGNLVPMAATLPGARFVGVDVSAAQLAEARRSARDREVDNVTLIAGDFREAAAAGPYDYIIAHGVYSWVDEATRDALLAFIGAQLQPHGVGYVSYNVYPGWHQAEMVRGLMRFHTAPFSDPGARVEQGLAIARWLADRAGRHAADDRAAFLAREVRDLEEGPPEYVLHDHLTRDNHPVWFERFVAHCRAHGLRFLSEARPFAMAVDNLDAEAQALLAQVPGLVRQQQYLDFIVNQRFRRTLVCRADAPVTRAVDSALLEAMWLWTPVARPDDVGAPDALTVTSSVGAPVTITSAPAVAALGALWSAGPGGLRFEPLFDAVCGSLGVVDVGARDALRPALRRDLLRLFFAEVLRASLRPPAG